jgi:hypothetical protein
MLFGNRFFEHQNHASFLDASFPDIAAGGRVERPWRIPFTHHPPYCAGPQHPNSRSMIKHLVPIFKRSGVKAVFSGHEHNFQHSRFEGINYFITGAGGKVRPERPSNFEDAHTIGWAASANFLIVKVTTDQMVVTPMAVLDATGELAELVTFDPGDSQAALPIVIDRK